MIENVEPAWHFAVAVLAFGLAIATAIVVMWAVTS